MTLVHLAVLALVQGITEFLPISSSGHLILVPILSDLPDQGLMLDVAVHMGSLAAVMLYFWRDLWEMASGLVRAARGRRDPGARLAGLVVLATVPVVVAGFTMSRFFDMDGLRTLEVVGWTTLGFGIVLGLADRFGMTIRRVEHMGWVSALMIGLAQVMALIPGTSRSGITMTAARMLGFEREAAARFSMLIGIPAIMGAGLLQGLELYRSGDEALALAALWAGGLAFIAALLAIWGLMAWLRRATFTPFVLYRVVLGVVLLALAYT